MDKESLLSAVRDGRLAQVRKLIKSLGLFYANEEPDGYDLLLVALRENHGFIAELLLLNDCKVNSGNDEYSVTPLHYAATNGDIEIVKMLLDRNAKIDAKDKYGRTSLYCAVEKSQSKIIKLLLNRKACVNASDRDGITPLHIASMESYSYIVKILLNYGAHIDPTSYLTPMQKFREGYTPLHYAVEKGSEEVTKLLLKNNTDVNIKALRGTPLHIATEEGYPQIVEDLLKSGAYVNSVCTSTGYTPLHLPCARGNTEVVRLLLDKGADVNVVAKDIVTPLFLAIEKGHSTIVKLLLEHGADFNSTDKCVRFKMLHGSLLHIAVEKGYQQIVEYLLNHGAYVNSICTSTGYTPLHIGSARGSMEIVESILSMGADVNAIGKDNLTPLYIAVKKNHWTVAKLLLEHGADVDAQDVDGKTILHCAVEGGSLDMIKDILMFGPDLRNKSNKSSINTAIYNYEERYRKIVECLIEYGFAVNTKDINNCKLLHAAVVSGFLELVEDFLQNGANVNMTSVRGYTLLHRAIIYQHETMAKLLISYGADVNAIDEFQKTPISYAVENLDLKITKLLVTKGANLRDSPNVILSAVREGCIAIVEILLERSSDIDVNPRKKFGGTAMQLRRRKTRTDSHNRKRQRIIEMHFDNQCVVNAKRRDGTTALHIAAYRGHDEIVEILLKYGAEVNPKAKGYMTPLHVAAQSGHPKIVETLLKFGADIDCIDQYDRTPLHIACLGRHRDVVVALLRNGSDINMTSQNNRTALDFAMPGLTFWQLAARYNDYDSDVDDDDFYDEVDDLHGILYSSEDIAEILLRHLAKMMAQKLFVNKQYLRTINKSAILKRLYTSVEMDITKMKNEKIGNTNISFYDVLTRGVHQLAICARNRGILDVFESREYKNMFPRYADMLENQFKNGQEREGLLNSSIKSFNSLFGYEVPHLFIDEMFSYLSNLDLKNLADACPHDTVIER